MDPKNWLEFSSFFFYLGYMIVRIKEDVVAKENKSIKEVDQKVHDE